MTAENQTKHKKTTLRSIARDLDMSVMTVARALNGNPRVSTETRLKVMNRVKELGFDFRSASRNAKKERVQEVAVYCSDERFYGDKLFNFFSRLYYYCVRELKAHGMRTTLLPQNVMNDPSPEVLAEYGTLLILGPFLPGKEMLEKWQERYPDLLIVSILGDPLPVSTVIADDYAGGACAARKLFERGHAHVAVFTQNEEQSLQKRFSGFSGEYFRLNEKVRIDRIFFQPCADSAVQLDSMHAALDRYFKGCKKKELPTAFFMTNGYYALVLADYLKKKGFSIPKDISIIGYDDLEAMEQYDPPIDRIAFELKQVAKQTAAFLCGDRSRLLVQHTQIIIENVYIPGKSLSTISQKGKNP